MDSLPRIVDRYELLAVLGAGGFAVVYRARHVHTHQFVAVKILEKRPNVATNVERFISEARAAAAVQHRNVVRILDCGQASATGEVFIVMELVDGQTLADALRNGLFAVQRATEIAIQILDGLSAAHARGIVHRDIKPPNILLTRDTDGSDLPKILDFGVSKQLTAISGTLDGTAIGTPGYMAPELFGGAKHADARADIYAVSVTLYEMISGRLPFSAATYEELVVQVATQRPAPISVAAPHVSSPIAAAVDRGLARDREARWQSADEFASALRGALLGIPPPSSHQFASTIHAASPNALVSSPSQTSHANPNASREPSTLRTAPPPVVNTASRAESRSRSVLGYVIGLVALVLVASGGGALAVWRVMRSAAPASNVATIDPSPTVATTSEPSSTAIASAADLAPAIATTKNIPEPTSATTTRSPRANGVHFTELKIVGTAHQSALVALEALVLPQAQRCRPDGNTPTVAHVDLFIGSEGVINLAHPKPDNPGDTVTAACLAEIFKKTASPKNFAPDGSGIATVDATFDPR